VSTTGKWDELFGAGRKWRVAEEMTGTVPADGYLGADVLPGLPVKFERGRFELPVGAAYRSLLSTNLGRRGVLLQETDETGASDIPGSRIAVGEPAVAKARQEYGAVW
jgi:hypothetical protein